MSASAALRGSRVRRIASLGPRALCIELSSPKGALAGKHVLVTSGPTYEDIDAVRYVGNRSSGRMGFAIAAEAACEVLNASGGNSVTELMLRCHERLSLRLSSR